MIHIGLRSQPDTHTFASSTSTATERDWDEQLGANILEELWTNEHMKSFSTVV